MQARHKQLLMTHLPLEVYVGYRAPAEFRVNGRAVVIENYIHKLQIAKVYHYDDYFKLRMDALRAFLKHYKDYGLNIEPNDASLLYTTVWAFQTWRYRVSMDNGNLATVDRKEYDLLSGKSNEYLYDQVLGL